MAKRSQSQSQAEAEAGDTVEVIAGKDKGKRGTIREVLPEAQRVKVSDVNIVKRHQGWRARRTAGRHRGAGGGDPHLERGAGGPEVDKPTRVGIRTLPDGSRVRFAKRCGEQI